MLTEKGVILSSYDDFTKSKKTIDTDHYYIHKGLGYCIHNYTALLAFGDKLIYRYVSPLTKYAHIKNIQVSSENATIKVTLKRGIVITGAGTLVTDSINNLNDNVENESGSKLYNGSVTYTGGTEWCSIVVHGGSTNQSSTSNTFVQSGETEYIAKNNETDYIIEIENIDEAEKTANNINLNMFLYEEERGYID